MLDYHIKPLELDQTLTEGPDWPQPDFALQLKASQDNTCLSVPVLTTLTPHLPPTNRFSPTVKAHFPIPLLLKNAQNQSVSLN